MDTTLSIIKGLSVSTGIALGKARFIKEKDLSIPENPIEEHEIDSHINLFRETIIAVIDQIDDFLLNFQINEDDKRIIETHKIILEDPELHKSIEKLIKEEKKNVEHALKIHFRFVVDFFKKLDNNLYSDRAIDYDDVYKRVIMYMKKIENIALNEIQEGDIILMDDIPPSWVSQLHRKKVVGIALYKGTKTSHSVIIARALGIPIVTGIKGAHKIYDGDFLILDACAGKIIIKPNIEIINKYKEQEQSIQKTNKQLESYKELSAKTVDCIDIDILSNIELSVETDQVIDLNSDGIGLFRTEFLYLNRQDLPSEEEQFLEYKMIIEKLGNKPITIRTIDIGGDKVAGWYSKYQRRLTLDKNTENGKVYNETKYVKISEENPFLGCRGIRFSLQNKIIFKTQLKAILRASVLGDVRVMFPMISSLEEFLEAKEILNECKKELKNKNISFNDNIKVGTMIEIPSAVIVSDEIAKRSDFFSIGTNDLLQYTVAADRNNENVVNYYNPYNPAFLLLICKTVKSALKHNIPVSICGELANDMNFTAFLLCLGVRELSVGNQHILGLKKHIRTIDITQGKPFVKEIVKCSTKNETEMVIKKVNNMCVCLLT